MAIGKWMEKQLEMSPPSSTIGKTKIIDGEEYWNMGDLYDQDNWRYIGPANFDYYINVYQEDCKIIYELSCEADFDAVYSEGFANRESAESKLAKYEEENPY